MEIVSSSDFGSYSEFTLSTLATSSGGETGKYDKASSCETYGYAAKDI